MPETMLIETGGGLLEQILSEGRLAPSKDDRQSALDWLEKFLGQIVSEEIKVSDNTEAMLNARIAAIDQALTNQLNEIMHHQKFQKLESSWRGLRYFVFQTETSTMLKIKLLNISKAD